MSQAAKDDEALPHGQEAAPAVPADRGPCDRKGGAGAGPRESDMRQRVGLVVGPLAFLIMLLIPTPSGMSVEAQRVAAVTLLMASWWISEAIPIPATSLLPIVLFPLLGVMPTSEATVAYGNHLIFLFMGGFIIALSMQRWELHRRIALQIIRLMGFSAGRLVFGFMLATAVLSAFVSNTATTVMMLPIGMAVITQIGDRMKRSGGSEDAKQIEALGLNLMLGIAYAASIGGVATLIGTPPNTVLASYLSKTYDYEITFAKWLLVGGPLVCFFLPLTWLWLTKIANPMPQLELPNARQMIDEELRKMGAMQAGERWTLLVFVLTSLSWIFRPQLVAFFPEPSMVKDATIALAGAVALFIIPINFRKRLFVMDWAGAVQLPWGVLILFGGGLALAGGFESSGLAAWVVGGVSLLDSLPLLLVVVLVTTFVVFLTELTSNTATATMLMPVLAGIAIGLNQSPLILLAPAALAASCAFMLPVATPPNAIVFGSGNVTIPQMVRGGFGVNLIGILLIPLIIYFLLVPIFGITLGELPDWAQ